MTGGFFTILPAVLLAMLLVAAAVSDLRRREIPNLLNFAVMLVAPLMWWVSGLTVGPDLAWQLASAGIVFALFVAHFYIGGIGGGDVKLIGALALSIAPTMILPMLMAIAISGAALSTAMLIHIKLRKPEHRPELPYGIAIAAGALWILPQQYINHFALIPST
jgi:prepilin peptidase CpaA